MSVLTFVNIGDEGNAVDSTGLGDVAYAYDISKFEITEGQISAYNADTINSTRQITTNNRGTDKPATLMSWNKCARYVNWLNIKEGLQPAYYFTTSGVNDGITLWSSSEAWQLGGENLYRHKDAKYFLPSEDEWYKAAYYKSGGINAGYWSYPTGSNTAPTAVASGTTAGTAVYNGQTAPADVDQAGGLSPYGVMGQGGNVAEWVEAAWDGTNDSVLEDRSRLNAAWLNDETYLRSSLRAGRDPATHETNFTGFRVMLYVSRSVLNFSDNIRSGSSQVSRVYSSDTIVWPTALWTAVAGAPAGATISGSSLSLSAASTLNLGDGTIVNVTTSTASIDHTY